MYARGKSCVFGSEANIMVESTNLGKNTHSFPHYTPIYAWMTGYTFELFSQLVSSVITLTYNICCPPVLVNPCLWCEVDLSIEVYWHVHVCLCGCMNV